MTGIQSIGRNLAMDGQPYYSPQSTLTGSSRQVRIPVSEVPDVAVTLADNLAKAKIDVQQLQKVADSMGNKIRFNVNEELGQVVVKIVDPSTDKVLREIPSEDMQQLRITIRHTIGLMVDEVV